MRTSTSSPTVRARTVASSAPNSAAAPANRRTAISGAAISVARVSVMGSSSSADRAHRALRLHEIGPVHAVAGLLAPLGGTPDLGDRLIVRSRAERRAQVGLLAGEQAGAHAALGGQAGAAAVGAEGAGHRGDDPHPAPVQAGGAVGDLVQLGGRAVARLGD